jgi:ankyrin repeat protein
MDIKCAACMKSFTRNCKISTTFCGHPFHTEFLINWLKTQNNCPKCKKPCTDNLMINIYFSRSGEARIGFQSTIDVVQSALQSPLHLAALYGQIEEYQRFCREFIENMSPRTVDGSMPLHFAASNGHSEICRIIMNMIDEKNPKNEDGNTPLHFAANSGYSGTIQILMNEVEEKKPKNNDGYTPLHLAAEKGNLEMVKLIMNQVPEVLHKMFHGKEPKAWYFVTKIVLTYCEKKLF